MEVRLKKGCELIGYTEELKPGVSRTLAAGPLQSGMAADECIDFEIRVVLHPTRITGEIYLGYALFAQSRAEAEMLPGYKPYGGGKPVNVQAKSKAGEGLFDA